MGICYSDRNNSSKKLFSGESYSNFDKIIFLHEGNKIAEGSSEEICRKARTDNLEDAFIKLVEDRPEYSEREIEKMEYQKELDNLREELESKKQAKNEEKARKKAKREEKKASKKDSQKIKKGDNDKSNKEEGGDK